MNHKFVVYVNHPRSYTMIHLTSCKYYVHSNQKDPNNGKWSERFRTLKDAKDTAKKEEKFVVLQLHQIIPVIQKILRKKLNEVPP
jgi:hypothetical protein